MPIRQASKTREACTLLGCELPIVLAGMGGVARSELVSAVSAPGAFGFLGMVREPPALIEQEVGRVRDAGHCRFGVNLIPAATEPDLLARQLDAIIALEVPVVELFWQIDTAVVGRLRDAGIAVVYQVGSVQEARTAERAGAQIVIAQGVEAGGHVRGITPLRDLLPAVVDAVHVPVLAAGGLARGSDLLTAAALGAQGIVLGTALMATFESFAHPYHRERLVEADAADTVLTSAFHINWPANAPVRVLRTPVVALGEEQAEGRVIGSEEGRPIYLFSTDSPLRSMTGDFASMALYAGTGVGEIKSIVSAADRIETILSEAEAALPAVDMLLAPTSSPVCLAGEFSGDYMGHADQEEVDAAVAALVEELRAIVQLTLRQQEAVPTGDHPPFRPEAASIAGWLWLLSEDRRSRFSNLPQGGSDIEARRLRARQILQGLLPRMSESNLRNTLSGLQAQLTPEFEIIPDGKKSGSHPLNEGSLGTV